MSSQARQVFVVIGVVVLGAVAWGIGELLNNHNDNPSAGKFGAILAFVVAAGMALLGIEAWRRLHPPARRASVSPLASFVSQTDDQAAQLLIHRPRSTASDLFRVYSVEVDRRHVADLKVGQSVQIAVPSGEHTVGARLLDQAAPSLNLVLQPGETARVSAQPTPGGAARRRTTGWLMLTADLQPRPGADFRDDPRGQTS